MGGTQIKYGSGGDVWRRTQKPFGDMLKCNKEKKRGGLSVRTKTIGGHLVMTFKNKGGSFSEALIFSEKRVIYFLKN